MITLRPLTLAECLQVREWRNDPAVLPMLRTGYKSEAEQTAFYWEWCYWPWWKALWWTLQRRPRFHRYYALIHNHQFIGLGGLTYVREFGAERHAEITLVLGPAFRGKGYGADAVDAILAEAWRLRVTMVKGECYAQGCQGFWRAQLLRRPELKWQYEDADGTLHWRWARPL